jgi:DNA-binding CsgD family transcriptional regulator
MDNSINRLLHFLLDELQDNTNAENSLIAKDRADHILLNTIRSCYGLQNIAYVTTDQTSLVTRKPTFKVTYSEEWQEFYKKTGAENHDPAILRGLWEIIPFEWQMLDDLEPDQEEFMNRADDFSLGKNGFSIPIRDRTGARALVSITTGHNNLKWAKYSRRYKSELVNIAYLLHERFSAKPNPANSMLFCGDDLTEREVESLQWAALGKTSEETAMILGLSRRSVNFHVNNAKNKLDTVTKSHAVARASALGLILPVI